jgi:hypothetical protein
MSSSVEPILKDANNICELRKSFCKAMHATGEDAEEAQASLYALRLDEGKEIKLKQDSLENFKCRLKRSSGFASERRPRPVVSNSST